MSSEGQEKSDKKKIQIAAANLERIIRLERKNSLLNFSSLDEKLQSKDLKSDKLGAKLQGGTKYKVKILKIFWDEINQIYYKKINSKDLSRLDYIIYSILSDKDYSGYRKYPDPESFFTYEYMISYIANIHKSQGDSQIDNTFFNVLNKRYQLSVMTYLPVQRKEKVSDKKKNIHKKYPEALFSNKQSPEKLKNNLEKELNDLTSCLENIWDYDDSGEITNDIVSLKKTLHELNSDNKRKIRGLKECFMNNPVDSYNNESIDGADKNPQSEVSRDLSDLMINYDHSSETEEKNQSNIKDTKNIQSEKASTLNRHINSKDKKSGKKSKSRDKNDSEGVWSTPPRRQAMYDLSNKNEKSDQKNSSSNKLENLYKDDNQLDIFENECYNKINFLETSYSQYIQEQYFRQQIYAMEEKQIAESIKFVADCKVNRSKLYLMELIFEDCITTKPVLVEECLFDKQNRDRDHGLLHYSNLDDIITNNNTKNTKDSKSNKRNSANKINGKSKQKSSNQTIQEKPQMTSGPYEGFPFPGVTLSKDALSKLSSTKKRKIKDSINDLYMCHHCRRVQEKEAFVNCTFKSRSTSKKKLIYTPGKSIKKIHNSFLCEFKKEQKLKCERRFCRLCLKYTYDEVQFDYNRWLCPACRGCCTCTRCMRSKILGKMYKYYISIGGNAELLERESPLVSLIKQITQYSYEGNIKRSLRAFTKNPNVLTINNKEGIEKTIEKSDNMKSLYGIITILISLFQKLELREITKKAQFKFNQQLFASKIKESRGKSKWNKKDSKNLYKTSSGKKGYIYHDKKKLKQNFNDEKLSNLTEKQMSSLKKDSNIDTYQNQDDTIEKTSKKSNASNLDQQKDFLKKRIFEDLETINDSVNQNEYLSICGSEAGTVSQALSLHKFMTDDELKTIKLYKGDLNSPKKRGRKKRLDKKKWLDQELDQLFESGALKAFDLYNKIKSNQSLCLKLKNLQH